MFLSSEIEFGNIKTVKIECSAVELLVLRSALEQFYENKENPTADLKVAKKMLDTKMLTYGE